MRRLIGLMLWLVPALVQAQPLPGLPWQQHYALTTSVWPGRCGLLQLRLEEVAAGQVRAEAQLRFVGLAGWLSGQRRQHYISWLRWRDGDAPRGLAHYQQVELWRKGRLLRYGWLWQRTDDGARLLAQRQWQGAVVEQRQLPADAATQTDLLSLLAWLVWHGPPPGVAPLRTRLVDPAGTIAVQLARPAPAAPLQLRFERPPLTLGCDALELRLDAAGRPVAGRLLRPWHGLPLHFELVPIRPGEGL